ncbi:MAG: HPr(Ser) kinase/phosphatase [Candidatus Hydrogenedentota bacterium]
MERSNKMNEFEIKPEKKECFIVDIIQSPAIAENIELIAGMNNLKKYFIREPLIHRPGLALAGYLEHFDYDKVQVFGQNEVSYLLSLPEKQLKKNLERYFSFPIPCIFITENMEIPPILLKYAVDKELPLIKVKEPTSDFIRKITDFLEEKLTPSITVHGVFMEVFGVGVLMIGKSGVGKSESALDLIERGHRLIADDVVDIKRMPGGILIGSGAHIIKHHMEIRGVGIINIRSIYGVRAIREQHRVDVIVNLEIWVETRDYDRLGLEDSFQNVMDIKVPLILIPVRPGRNIAVIIEVAAMNQRLKMMGYHAAREFNKKLVEWIENQDKI